MMKTSPCQAMKLITNGGGFRFLGQLACAIAALCGYARKPVRLRPETCAVMPRTPCGYALPPMYHRVWEYQFTVVT